MIRFKVDEAKSNFLDEPAIIEAIGEAKASRLARGGGLIRTTAHRSMRDAPKGKLKKIRELRKQLSKGVRYAIERKRIRDQLRKLQRDASSPPGKPPRAITGLLKDLVLFAWDPRSESVVIGPAKLNKPSEVPSILEDGGTEVVTRTIRVKGRKVKTKRVVSVKPHPYMGPALDKSKDKLGPLWANAVKP